MCKIITRKITHKNLILCLSFSICKMRVVSPEGLGDLIQAAFLEQ